MLTNQNQNITPFSMDGVNSYQQTNQQPQPPGVGVGVPETNRKRHFRGCGNYSELATVTSLNAALGFTFRMIQVAPVGFIAVGILSASYYIITASNERKLITYFFTGLSGGVAGLATLSEPIGDWITEQSGTKDYYATATPAPAINVTFVGAIALSLIIGITLLTRKDS